MGEGGGGGRAEGLWFLFVTKLFLSTASLNLQLFSDPTKSKQFFLSGSMQNNFFHHLFHLILCTLQVLEVSPHLPGLSTVIFDKESYCVEYVEQNC